MRRGPVSVPVSQRGWVRAGNVLLVVVVTVLQVTGPRAGSPVRAPVLLGGAAGVALGQRPC